MTSRERLLQTLKHQEPSDRIAIDFGSTEASGIALRTYVGVKKLLGINTPSRMYNVKQSLAEVEPDVLERIGGDVVPLRYPVGPYGIDNSQWRSWKAPWGDECLVGHNFDPIETPDGGYEIRKGDMVLAKMPADGCYFEAVYRYPLRDAQSESDVTRLLSVNPGEQTEKIDYLASEAERLYTSTDKAIVYRGDGNMFYACCNTWGYDRFLTLFYDAPNLVELTCEILAERAIKTYSRLLPRIRDYVNVVVIGDDLGTQIGLPIRAEMYRKYIKPWHSKVFRYIKENSNCYVMLHSDGAFVELIPDLIEAGIDILNPIQYNTPGMDAEHIKKTFGKDLSFWGGGCDTQTILPCGSPEEVRREAEKMISILGKGGGYVFCQVHNILADVPPENVIALYDTARQMSLS